jgi:N-methylhydantoinase A
LRWGSDNRHRIYDLAYRKEPSLVPGALRFGVRERTLCTGQILETIDMEEVKGILPKIREAGAESVAVCFLFSCLNPAHERRMGDLLDKLNIPVSLSHEILSEFREYERTSTTLINAYVSPKMKGYVPHLMNALDQGDSLRVMQSNGGSISAEIAMCESVRTILSGPAGGAVGAYEIGKRAGFDKIISFDMGGTSTDVSLMDHRLSLTLESQIAGYPVKVPMIDIHTVGAGGMHAAYLARLLGIPKVLAPNSPGILSAIGMLMADIIKDYSLTVMRNQFTTDWEKLSQLFLSLETKGRDDLIAEGIDEKGIILEPFLDMRYAISSSLL